MRIQVGRGGDSQEDDVMSAPGAESKLSKLGSRCLHGPGCSAAKDCGRFCLKRAWNAMRRWEESGWIHALMKSVTMEDGHGLGVRD